MLTDVRVRHYFNAATAQKRDSWVAALNVEIAKAEPPGAQGVLCMCMCVCVCVFCYVCVCV